MWAKSVRLSTAKRAKNRYPGGGAIERDPTPIQTGEGLLSHRADEPERSGMRLAVQDSLRGPDILNILPFVDTTRIAVHGGSQGGGLALAVAALRPGVAAVASGVPFPARPDLEFDAVRAEPYAELQRAISEGAATREQVLRMTSFVDVTAFLSRVHQPCLIVYSPDDDIAPPTGIADVAATMDNVRLDPRPEGHASPALSAVRETIDSWLGAQLSRSYVDAVRV